MYEKKIILKDSVPTVGTGGLKKILTVSEQSVFCTWGLAFSVWGLYQKKSLALRASCLGFSVRLHESKKRKL